MKSVKGEVESISTRLRSGNGSKNSEQSTLKQKTNNSCVASEKPVSSPRFKIKHVSTNSRQKKTRNNKNDESDQEKINKTQDRTLDDLENWHVSIDIEKCDKNSQIQKTQKCVPLSPNHKLTEYFSNLHVDDESSNAICEETDTNKKQEIENYEKSNKKNTLNLKQAAVDTSSQTRKKNTSQYINKSENEVRNHKVTDYFKVRRSERKYKKDIDDEKQKDLENKIISKTEDGLEIKEFEEKGRGIVTTKQFYKGDFVVEYVGDLINGATAKQRELKYSKNKNIGCYMYYFRHKNNLYCIDATEESGKLGRLINHSRKGNLISKVVEINKTPHLILLAKNDISVGTEILYDYGDRNRESIKYHPWLNL